MLRAITLSFILFAFAACGTAAVTNPPESEIPISPTALASVSTPTPAVEEAVEDVGESSGIPESCFPDGPGDAEVVFVRAVETAADVWTFHVTLNHPDTGWEDYTDAWSVFDLSCEPILSDPADDFTRLLLHPHENEMPFTRSQAGLMLGEKVVLVHAHDTTDGWSPQPVVVDLVVPDPESDLYEVERAEE